MMRWGFLGICLFFYAAGCSRTATVSGTVKYQGKPVVYGSIVLLDSANIARTGVITPEGTYTVEGVTPGPVRIAILSRDPAKDRRKFGAPRDAIQQWFPLPSTLENAETSGVERTVGSGRVRLDLEFE